MSVNFITVFLLTSFVWTWQVPLKSLDLDSAQTRKCRSNELKCNCPSCVITTVNGSKITKCKTCTCNVNDCGANKTKKFPNDFSCTAGQCTTATTKDMPSTEGKTNFVTNTQENDITKSREYISTSEISTTEKSTLETSSTSFETSEAISTLNTITKAASTSGGNSENGSKLSTETKTFSTTEKNFEASSTSQIFFTSSSIKATTSKAVTSAGIKAKAETTNNVYGTTSVNDATSDSLRTQFMTVTTLGSATEALSSVKGLDILSTTRAQSRTTSEVTAAFTTASTSLETSKASSTSSCSTCNDAISAEESEKSTSANFQITSEVSTSNGVATSSTAAVNSENLTTFCKCVDSTSNVGKSSEFVTSPVTNPSTECTSSLYSDIANKCSEVSNVVSVSSTGACSSELSSDASTTETSCKFINLCCIEAEVAATEITSSDSECTFNTTSEDRRMTTDSSESNSFTESDVCTNSSSKDLAAASSCICPNFWLCFSAICD